jgi:phosphoglycerate dehydrogenase-like enzyme
VSVARLRVVAPEVNPAVPAHPQLERLAGVADVVLYREPPASVEELFGRFAGAHVFLNPRPHHRLTREFLTYVPDLLMVAVIGVGVDGVDLDAATELGIVVCNTPGVNAASVAEHTIGLLLDVARHITRGDRDMRAGRWQHHETPELEGKTLGVIGLGDIGGRVARIGAAFGMRVLAWTRTADAARAAACGARLVERETLLRESDAICLCIAATPETRHLIDARALALMKPGAVLVNTGRGALLDEPALIAALQEGRIAGAALDVFDTEPLPTDSLLRSLENVVLTPHSAWASRESLERSIRVPVENILAYAAGRPRNVVNPAALNHERQKRLLSNEQRATSNE